VANSITGAAFPCRRPHEPRLQLLLDRTFTQREHALMLENGIQRASFAIPPTAARSMPILVSAILDGEDNMVISNADYDFVDIYKPDRMQAYAILAGANTFYWMRLIQQGEEGWRKRQDRAYFGWTTARRLNNNGNEAALWPKLFDWGMNSAR